MAIPELMRVLIDQEGMDWDTAWDITKNTVAYTNHTIMPEALETWPIDMFKNLVPRIYMIVEEINARFLEDVRKQYPNDEDRVRRVSIIQDGVVHMARLSVVGSHSVNGVAKFIAIFSKHILCVTLMKFTQVNSIIKLMVLHIVVGSLLQIHSFLA